MSSRNNYDLLLDILESIRRAKIYSNDLEYKDFIVDLKTQDSVIPTLEILGEATKAIDTAIMKEHTEIPWKSMMGMRDKLIHNYFGINLEALYGFQGSKKGDRQEVTKVLPYLVYGYYERIQRNANTRVNSPEKCHDEVGTKTKAKTRNLPSRNYWRNGHLLDVRQHLNHNFSLSLHHT